MAAQFRRETDSYACSYFVENLPLGADLGNGATNENLEQLTLPDHSVDVFITQDVLEHVYNPQKAFQEIERVLSVGGGTFVYYTNTAVCKNAAARVL